MPALKYFIIHSPEAVRPIIFNTSHLKPSTLLHNLGLYFISQNIIKVGSALLDPGNKEHWEQIQRTEGGTAHLLRHYEEYFNNVARNMKKTYMRPFVIVATNMSEYLCWKLPFFFES